MRTESESGIRGRLNAALEQAVRTLDVEGELLDLELG